MTAPGRREGNDRLVTLLLDTAQPALRVAELKRLVPLAGAMLWPAIGRMLESPDVEERLAAILAAEQTRCCELEERLLHETASADARIASAATHAVAALADLRSKSALQAMLDGLGCAVKL